MLGARLHEEVAGLAGQEESAVDAEAVQVVGECFSQTDQTGPSMVCPSDLDFVGL
jgi:hypothetical protein